MRGGATLSLSERLRSGGLRWQPAADPRRRLAVALARHVLARRPRRDRAVRLLRRSSVPFEIGNAVPLDDPRRGHRWRPGWCTRLGTPSPRRGGSAIRAACRASSGAGCRPAAIESAGASGRDWRQRRREPARAPPRGARARARTAAGRCRGSGEAAVESTAAAHRSATGHRGVGVERADRALHVQQPAPGEAAVLVQRAVAPQRLLARLAALHHVAQLSAQASPK